MKKFETSSIYEPPPLHLIDCAPEQALCYDFIDEAQLYGWRVLPEYPDSTLDLLLIAEEWCSTKGAKPGMQIGVQAKMSSNPELLNQLLKSSEVRSYRTKGPDYVCALVPVRPRTPTEQTIEYAVQRLRLGFFYVYSYFEGTYTSKRKNLEDLSYCGDPLKFKSRIDLPEIESWTEPGVASPTPITNWKLRAIKFCIEAASLGDKLDYTLFSKHKMHIQTWLHARWIIQTGKEGRRFLYSLNPDSKDRPDVRHAELTEKLKAKAAPTNPVIKTGRKKKNASQGEARQKSAA